MLALGICFLQTFSSAGRRIAACALLPTNRFVSITTNSIKYLVSWTPLRICVRSRNTRLHVNEWIRMDHSWKRVTRGSSGLKHLCLSGAQKFHTKVISHKMVHLYEVHQSSTCVTSLNYRCDSLFQIISNAGIALEMYLLQHRSSLATTHTAMLASRRSQVACQCSVFYRGEFASSTGSRDFKVFGQWCKFPKIELKIPTTLYVKNHPKIPQKLPNYTKFRI